MSEWANFICHSRCHSQIALARGGGIIVAAFVFGLDERVHFIECEDDQGVNGEEHEIDAQAESSAPKEFLRGTSLVPEGGASPRAGVGVAGHEEDGGEGEEEGPGDFFHFRHGVNLTYAQELSRKMRRAMAFGVGSPNCSYFLTQRHCSLLLERRLPGGTPDDLERRHAALYSCAIRKKCYFLSFHLTRNAGCLYSPARARSGCVYVNNRELR